MPKGAFFLPRSVAVADFKVVHVWLLAVLCRFLALLGGFEGKLEGHHPACAHCGGFRSLETNPLIFVAPRSEFPCLKAQERLSASSELPEGLRSRSQAGGKGEKRSGRSGKGVSKPMASHARKRPVAFGDQEIATEGGRFRP